LNTVVIMILPLAPFISQHLYLTSTYEGKKKSVLLEDWPKASEGLRDIDLERAFDTAREIVSVANAARNIAGLKRRWPLSEVLICGAKLGILEKMDGISDALKSQLNVEEYRLVEMPTGSHLEK